MMIIGGQTLRTLGPTVRAADLRIVRPPPKTADPFYSTLEWRTLRHACLVRDGFRCTAPDCDHTAIVADHIVSRRDGGRDELGNLRSLCRLHDNRVKEDHTGARRGRRG
jgi:5-methylcytosine-specific restriction endonuclease McrA